MYESLADQAMAAVRQLEESGALGTGGRLPALLRYLVQEELAGRGDRLKAYAIATEVLGRARDFDPQQDSIVRVEIGRLRKALDLYFATQGRDEPVRIEIPRGVNRPRITGAAPSAETAPSRRRLWPAAGLIASLAVAVALAFVWTRQPPAPAAFAPRLILLPVQTQGGDPDLRALALGLRAELAAELSLQSWLTVATLDAVPSPAGRETFAAATVLVRDADAYGLSVQLASEPAHNVIWSGRYRDARLHAPLLDLASGLAGELARDLGYPLGPIGKAVGARSGATDAEVEDRFLCMINAYRYWRDLEPKQRADAHDCLTRLTAVAPDFAQGRAALALLAIEEGRAGDAAAFAKAAALLRGSPDDRLTLMARMTLSACQGDAEATRTLAHALAAAAPNDPDSLAEAAYRAGLGAQDWAFALETEARAQRLARGARPGYAAAAKAVIAGDYEAALRAISLAPQPGRPLGQAMLLIVAELANAPLRAEGATAALARLQIGDADALKATIGRACWRPEIKAAFLDAAARAGTLGAKP